MSLFVVDSATEVAKLGWLKGRLRHACSSSDRGTADGRGDSGMNRTLRMRYCCIVLG